VIQSKLLFWSLLLVVGLSAGACRSSRESSTDIGYGNTRKRDYYSNNKRSLSFLMDSFRGDRVDRRETRRVMWDWAEIRADNKRIRKESVAFVGKTLTIHDWDNFKHAWGTGLPRELSGGENQSFGDAVRFGFLDSGE
jgi:hypothetical protein